MNDPDIRPILRGRIQSIETELVDIATRQKQLSDLKDSLTATLAQEEALLRKAYSSPNTEHNTSILRTDGMSLSDLILKALATGPKSLGQLKDIGAGWFASDSNKMPGRAINFALVGLLRGGHVEQVHEGWRLVSGESRKGSGAPVSAGAPRQ